MLSGFLSADDDVAIDDGGITVLVGYSYVNRLIQLLEGIVGVGARHKVPGLRRS